MDFTITPMLDADWPHVRAIYRDGIATGNATFETDAPPWEEWDRTHRREGRLVARAGDQVLGWVALGPASRRRAYAGVADVSLYVAAAARGHGVGTALLRAAIEAAERAGIWTIQAGVFPENAASLAVHRACGFREVGRRERFGCMNGVWRDVLLLERRSRMVGV
jgi:phosphinothricin acetyltransferase